MLGVIFLKITLKVFRHNAVITASEQGQGWKSSPAADAQPQNYKRSGNQQGRTLINALNSFNEICGLLTHFPDFASRGQACGTVSMNPPVLWLPC